SNVARTAALPAKPLIIPTDCEPWPGKINANVIACRGLSDAGEHRAPGEAAAHAFHQHQVARLDASVAHGEIERERYGSSRGVGMLVHGHDDLLRRNLEPTRCRLDDADVGLMRDEPVELRALEAVGR